MGLADEGASGERKEGSNQTNRHAPVKQFRPDAFPLAVLPVANPSNTKSRARTHIRDEEEKS